MDSLWRRASSGNVRCFFLIFCRWPIYLINSVGKTRFSCFIPPPTHGHSTTVSLETNPLYCIISSYAQQAVKVIEEHNSSRPLFLYLSFQNVHSPVKALQHDIDRYSFINNKVRRTYAAMLDIVDQAIGNVTRSLEKAG